jgi:hypothetical protein
MEIVQDKVVSFKISPTIFGKGRICGVATTEQPVIGRNVILEILESTGIDPATYPYSHIVVPESMLKEGHAS